jgi:hypothetical protein
MLVLSGMASEGRKERICRPRFFALVSGAKDVTFVNIVAILSDQEVAEFSTVRCFWLVVWMDCLWDKAMQRAILAL